MLFLQLPERAKPRAEGLTVLMDIFISIPEVEDLLEVASETFDYAKFVHAGLLLGDTLPLGWVERKVELYKSRGIKTYPGGVCYQAALLQNKVEEFFRWTKAAGFDGLEIAEDALDFPTSFFKKRDDHIKRALDLGLFVDTELGKKLADEPMDLVQAEDDMQHDLELGVAHVVVERAELDFYIDGDATPFIDMVNRVGLHNVVLEPGSFGWPKYHKWCLKTFGPKVNLSNINKEELIYLEMSRRGLSRFSYAFFDGFDQKAASGN